MRSNTNITSYGWEQLADHVMEEVKRLGDSREMRLRELNLDYCGLTDDSIKVLSPIIPYLEVVDLRYNWRITSSGSEQLADHVMQELNRSHTVKLKQIYVNHENGGRMLREKFKDYPHIEVITKCTKC